MGPVKKHCKENIELLQYRKQMPKASPYSQFEMKPVRNFGFKKQAHSLSSFFSGNNSSICFLFSETLEESFKESQLVRSLHKLLQDENTSPEVKYNSMGLLCSLLNSGNLILNCLWWKDGYLWGKQVFSVIEMCSLQCCSQWVVKDTEEVHSLLITRNPSQVVSFFMKSWINHQLN